MAGFELKEGHYCNKIVSEEELWRAFEQVFSSKTINVSSYKFIFLKSIIDNLDRTTVDLSLSFNQLFSRFAEIYWILVVRFGLRQATATISETYIEQIFHDYVGLYNGVARIQFYDLSETVRSKIVNRIISKCKTYVIGALYQDTQELFYSFSKREKYLKINPQMYKFIMQHKESIEELNYYELAKFLNKINNKEKVKELRKIFNINENVDSLEVFRKVIYIEIELKDEIKVNNYIDTFNIVSDAQDKYNKAIKLEDELKKAMNSTINSKEEYIVDDEESMKQYLGDPEKIIKMLQVRRGIINKR